MAGGKGSHHPVTVQGPADPAGERFELEDGNRRIQAPHCRQYRLPCDGPRIDADSDCDTDTDSDTERGAESPRFAPTTGRS